MLDIPVLLSCTKLSFQRGSFWPSLIRIGTRLGERKVLVGHTLIPYAIFCQLEEKGFFEAGRHVGLTVTRFSDYSERAMLFVRVPPEYSGGRNTLSLPLAVGWKFPEFHQTDGELDEHVRKELEAMTEMYK